MLQHRRAIEFIRQQSEGGRPFFLMLSTPACHAPFTPANPYKLNFTGRRAPRHGSFNVKAKVTMKYCFSVACTVYLCVMCVCLYGNGIKPVNVDCLMVFRLCTFSALKCVVMGNVRLICSMSIMVLSVFSAPSLLWCSLYFQLHLYHIAHCIFSSISIMMLTVFPAPSLSCCSLCFCSISIILLTVSCSISIMILTVFLAPSLSCCSLCFLLHLYRDAHCVSRSISTILLTLFLAPSLSYCSLCFLLHLYHDAHCVSRSISIMLFTVFLVLSPS